MNSSINKKSTNNTTIYEDLSHYVMNCDSLSSSFEEIIIETDSEVIQKFLSNKNDALAPIDNYLDETSLREIIVKYVPLLIHGFFNSKTFVFICNSIM